MRKNRIAFNIILLATLAVSLTFRAEGQAADSQINYKIIKGGCEGVKIEGYVTTVGGVTPIPGVLMTGTFHSDDDVDEIIYYNHSSYTGAPQEWTISVDATSRSVTDQTGYFIMKMDVCPDGFLWEANFDICSNKEGYFQVCHEATFDEGDDGDGIDFELTPSGPLPPTPTPTRVPVPTPTPTTPVSPRPTAVHPELDVDHDGVIGPGDLLLLLADWLRPVN